MCTRYRQRSISGCSISACPISCCSICACPISGFYIWGLQLLKFQSLHKQEHSAKFNKTHPCHMSISDSEAIYRAHIRAAGELYDAQKKFTTAKKAVKDLTDQLDEAKSVLECAKEDIDRKRSAATGLETHQPIPSSGASTPVCCNSSLPRSLWLTAATEGRCVSLSPSKSQGPSIWNPDPLSLFDIPCVSMYIHV